MKKPHKISSSRSVVLFCAAFLVAALAGGCQSFSAGAGNDGTAGVVAYIRGDLQSNLDATLDESLSATNQAIETLRFGKVSQVDDALSGTIVCRTAQDQKITIALSRVTDSVTAIAIRVGAFGDEEVSLTMLNEIKEAL